MAKITGKSGKVLYGTVVVAEITDWSISGVTHASTTAPTAFNDTYMTKETADASDPGQITFKGNYDPSDTAGQAAISTIVALGTHLTNIYLYVAAATYWYVGAGGYILVTKGKAITFPRTGWGSIDFAGEVSGAEMTQAGTGS